MSDSHAGHHHEEEHVGHIVSMPVMIGTFLALLILTFITVAVTRVDLGDMNIVIAIAIATVKASLVAMYFMHLRYDAPFNGIILVISLVAVAFFIVMALVDTGHYQNLLIQGYAPAIQQSTGQ
jgi:cytochrome c oxidase subunit 4